MPGTHDFRLRPITACKIGAVSRSSPLVIFAFIAALLGATGLINSPADLLMISPFLALGTLLLAGLYPGESKISRLVELLDSPRRSASTPGDSPIVLDLPRSLSRLVCGSLGSRGPPAFSA